MPRRTSHGCRIESTAHRGKRNGLPEGVNTRSPSGSTPRTACSSRSPATRGVQQAPDPLADVPEPPVDALDDLEQRTPHVTRIRCWTVDRTRLVQLAHDSVAMNLVSPEGTYPGWPPFVGDVVRPTWDVLRQHAAKARPVSLALNTLDRFAVPLSTPLGEFLNCGGPRIPSVLADTTQAFDYDIGRGLLKADQKNRQLHISGRPHMDAYVINIHGVFHETIAGGGDVLAKLEQLHDDANEVFESLLTDRTRNEVMKGTAHAVTSL